MPPRRLARGAGRGLLLLSLLLARAGRADEGWPPFLLPPTAFSAEVRAEVSRVWTGYTLRRVVQGRPARAPLDLYRLFVDHPDVTAAAARHLEIARYRAEPVGPGEFAAEDGEGARGTWRVLLQDERRRIVLTRGSHDGAILGRIGGASLTILSFEGGTDGGAGPEVTQQIETFVLIDHPVAAFFARLLFPLFSRYADRKIAETFNVTARVSEWAAAEPAAFCAWLAGADALAARLTAFPCR
jgi:hypothetical protein